MSDPVTEYLAQATGVRKERLAKLREMIEKACPDGAPSLRHGMPHFATETGWIALASQKHHLSVYTCQETLIAPYLAAHPGTDHGKGCLRWRDGAEIDWEALREVVERALRGGEGQPDIMAAASH